MKRKAKYRFIIWDRELSKFVYTDNHTEAQCIKIFEQCKNDRLPALYYNLTTVGGVLKISPDWTSNLIEKYNKAIDECNQKMFACIDVD